MRSVRDSRETPGGGTLMGDVIPVRRGGEQGGRLGSRDGVEQRGGRGRVRERLGSKVEADDLVVFDVIDLGGSSDQVQGLAGEGSGVSVETVVGVAGGLEDLGDSIEGG